MIPIAERNKVIDNIIEMHGGNPQVEQFLQMLNGTHTGEFAVLLEQLVLLFNEVSEEGKLDESLVTAVKDPRFQSLVDDIARVLNWERKVAENICVWLYFQVSLFALEIADARAETNTASTDEALNPYFAVFGCIGIALVVYYLFTLFV